MQRNNKMAKLNKKSKPTIVIGKVWYSKTKDKSKVDYKIIGMKNSPAGTLKEWRDYARKKKIKLKVSKRLWR